MTSVGRGFTDYPLIQNSKLKIQHFLPQGLFTRKYPSSPPQRVLIYGLLVIAQDPDEHPIK